MSKLLRIKQPLRLKQNTFKVEVLGTQFDVMARESVSSVAVKEGKVRVKLPVNSEVVIDDKTIKKAKVDLLPGDKLTFKDDKYFVTKVDR